MNKLWPVVKLIDFSLEFTSLTFLIFFLWDQTENFYIILIFSLLHFLATPFAATVSGILTDKISPKIGLLTASVIQISALSFLFLYSESITVETAAMIGLVTGIGNGLNETAFNVLERFNNRDSVAKTYAQKSFIVNLASLLLPLVAAYIITFTGEYRYLFILIILLEMLFILIISLYKSDIPKNNFEFYSLLKFDTNRQKVVLAKASFFEGIFDGITLVILPVVLLVFAGSIVNWGVVNSMLVVFSIILSLILTKFITEKSTQWIYALGAVIFAGASIIIISQFNFYIILVYLIGMTFMEVIKDIEYYTAMDEIIEYDRRGYKLEAEYRSFMSIFGSLGKLLPLIIMIVIGYSIENELVVRGSLLVAGLLPVIILSILGESVIFHPKYKEELRLHNAR